MALSPAPSPWPEPLKGPFAKADLYTIVYKLHHTAVCTGSLGSG